MKNTELMNSLKSDRNNTIDELNRINEMHENNELSLKAWKLKRRSIAKQLMNLDDRIQDCYVREWREQRDEYNEQLMMF